MQQNLPHICPSCSATLKVKSLVCSKCSTEVTGLFSLPLLASLTNDEQAFIVEFVKSSGSLKLMAQKMGLSYPTVRNVLDDVINKIEITEKSLNTLNR
jgi:hypothetical protein